MSGPPIFVLGVGYTGRAVLRLAEARGLAARGVVRREEAARALTAEGHDVVRCAAFDDEIRAHVPEGAHVIVTFPPDGSTDALARGALDATGRVASMAYVSATSVYGAAAREVDDTTKVAPDSPAAHARLAAEATWAGATILRAPAIYGADRGLHVRVRAGLHRVPGDGSGFISRIHVDDLAALLVAARRAPGETFVVGDAEPARHADVVRFVCETHGVPMPPSIPLEEAHATLRGDRRVDGSRALDRLGVTLAFPSYRVGMG